MFRPANCVTSPCRQELLGQNQNKCTVYGYRNDNANFRSSCYEVKVLLEQKKEKKKKKKDEMFKGAVSVELSILIIQI